MTNYKTLAKAIGARLRCIESGNPEWEKKWTEQIEAIEELLPSGSGFDAGSRVDIKASRPNRIVLSTSFHHMDEAGGYDGWTRHEIIITPDAEMDYSIRITGQDRNGIKEYIGEIVDCFLSDEAVPAS